MFTMLNKKYLKFIIIIGFGYTLVHLAMYASTPAVFKRIIRSSNNFNVFGRRTQDLPELEIKHEIQRNLPSIPFDYLERNAGRTLRKNASCAYYPNLMQLEIDNIYWQIYRNKNLTYKLYGAYYDKRKIIKGPAVRILTMINLSDREVVPKSYCQIWFDYIPRPIIVPVAEHKCIWPGSYSYSNWFYAFFLTCYIPESHANKIPKTVSLVDKECETAKNNLKIHFNDLAANETKQGFAVCHKGLDFPFIDYSLRLTEWFEAVRLLGAKKVGMYMFDNHPNVVTVLKYYQETGFAEITPFNMPDGQPSAGGYAHLLMQHNRFVQFMQELIPYNDCFYKNMYKYEYIALIDTDELIMPLGDLRSWHDLIEAARKQVDPDCADTGLTSYCFRNVYFPHYGNNSVIHDEVPAHMYMLQHVRRIIEPLPPGSATKCLHNTDYVIGLHNHYPSIYKGACSPGQVNTDLGIMHHYRHPDNGQYLTNASKLDFSLWRFKDQLIERTEEVLTILQAKGFT